MRTAAAIGALVIAAAVLIIAIALNTPSPPGPAVSSAAPQATATVTATAPPAGPCASAVALVTPVATVTRDRLQTLIDTPALSAAQLAAIGDDLLRNTADTLELVGSAEWKSALVGCRAAPTDHAELTLLGTTIGVATVRVEEIRQTGRVTPQDWEDLAGGVDIITAALTLT